MSRHRRLPAPASPQRSGRLTAAALVSAGALAATLLTAVGRPAAPPAPDREPRITTPETARLSGI
ncbi:hypothetical protein [Streptomyces sp. NPDC053431]|uniref:hypothetical protein n=1 Tax=Streptomyces sp. NPDC053431 TaxID=3365703 RepID=UPI0037D8FE42